jgi:hypothetical protein
MNLNTISSPWQTMPTKTENQNKSIQNECLVKFASRNVASNEFLLIFSLFIVYQL